MLPGSKDVMVFPHYGQTTETEGLWAKFRARIFHINSSVSVSTYIL